MLEDYLLISLIIGNIIYIADRSVQQGMEYRLIYLGILLMGIPFILIMHNIWRRKL